MSERASLLDGLRAGASLCRRHAGLVLALYLVQLVLSSIAGFVVARSLATAFADRPLFDHAAGGDVLAIITVLMRHGAVFAAALWACFGFVLAYAMLSWFTTAGLLATAHQRPPDARATAEAFGGGGAANTFGLARLFAWCLIPYAAIAFVAVVGLAVGLQDIVASDSAGTIARRGLLGLAPGLLAWWITNTAVDFARIDLVIHQGGRRRKSALMALLRGYARAFTTRPALPLTALFHLVVIGLTVLFVALTAGVELAWFPLLLLRQLLAITRFLAKVCLLGAEVAVDEHRS